MVDQECQDGRGNNEELHPECVVVPVISGFEFAVNHPDCGEGASNVDYLLKGMRKRALQLTVQHLSPQ